MSRFLQAHYLIVFGGLVIGLFFGVFVVDARPAVLGWVFGAGAGLTGGAFIAAIATGQQIVSGPEPKGDIFEGYQDLDEIEREVVPHILDDLPPRQERAAAPRRAAPRAQGDAPGTVSRNGMREDQADIEARGLE